MGIKLTKSENKKLLHGRVNNGETDQYFEDLDSEDVKKLVDAINSDNFEEMATVLVNNLSSGSQGFEPALNSSYDAEVEMMSNRLVGRYLDTLEVETANAIRQKDVGFINTLIENNDFYFPSGNSKRASQIISQLKEAKKIFVMPSERTAKRTFNLLVKKKGKNMGDVKKTGVYTWGKYKRPAFVVFGKKGILTYKYVIKQKPFKSREKISYKPTRDIGSKPIITLKSKKGLPFGVSERMFIQARKNKSSDEAYDDYTRTFGTVRNKSEFVKQFDSQNK